MSGTAVSRHSSPSRIPSSSDAEVHTQPRWSIDPSGVCTYRVRPYPWPDTTPVTSTESLGVPDSAVRSVAGRPASAPGTGGRICIGRQGRRIPAALVLPADAGASPSRAGVAESNPPRWMISAPARVIPALHRHYSGFRSGSSGKPDTRVSGCPSRTHLKASCIGILPLRTLSRQNVDTTPSPDAAATFRVVPAWPHPDMPGWAEHPVSRSRWIPRTPGTYPILIPSPQPAAKPTTPATTGPPESPPAWSHTPPDQKPGHHPA